MLFAHHFGYEHRELVNRSFRELYLDTKEFVAIGELWRTHLASGMVLSTSASCAGRTGNVSGAGSTAAQQPQTIHLAKPYTALSRCYGVSPLRIMS